MDEYVIAEKIITLLRLESVPLSFAEISDRLDLDYEKISAGIFIINAHFPTCIHTYKSSNDISTWKAAVESYYFKTIDQLKDLGGMSTFLSEQQASKDKNRHNQDLTSKAIVDCIEANRKSNEVAGAAISIARKAGGDAKTALVISIVCVLTTLIAVILFFESR